MYLTEDVSPQVDLHAYVMICSGSRESGHTCQCHWVCHGPAFEAEAWNSLHGLEALRAGGCGEQRGPYGNCKVGGMQGLCQRTLRTPEAACARVWLAM